MLIYIIIQRLVPGLQEFSIAEFPDPSGACRGEGLAMQD